MGGRKFTTVNISDLDEEDREEHIELKEDGDSDLGEIYEQIDEEEDELSSVYEGEEEEPEEDNKIDFGKKIRDYYQDESSSDEELEEKIKEAKQLNEDLFRNLATESADLLNISSASDISKVLNEAFKGDVSMEDDDIKNKIPISDEERLKLIEKYHPEFIALVNDLHTNINQAYENILPLLNTARYNKFCTRDGIEYLDLRNELILIYLTYFAYYMILKINGKSIKDHPVIERLLEIRLLLDKAKPIESRLAYEISKLIELASNKGGDLEAVERSRPDQLVTDEESEDEDISDDDSVIPLDSTAPEFVTDKHSKTISKLDKIIEKQGSAAKPYDDDVVDNEMVKFMENEKLEQERMMRIFNAQKAKSKLKDGFSELDSLADSITSSKAWDSLKEYKQLKETHSNAIKTGLNTIKQVSEHSKHELHKKFSPDLPVKVVRDKGKPTKKLDISDTAQRKPRDPDSLDILSSGLKKVKSKKSIPVVTEELVEGPRLVSHEILKNKGLTRKRKRSQGNARVANRAKYERSLKKIPKKASGQTGDYVGESTGINADVKKSVTVL